MIIYKKVLFKVTWSSFLPNIRNQELMAIAFLLKSLIHASCSFLTQNSFAKGKACSACPKATCDNGLCSCGNPDCGKFGRLNLRECTCRCRSPFTGAACDEKNCPAKDKWFCGTKTPPNFCKKYGNAGSLCPYMCDVC